MRRTVFLVAGGTAVFAAVHSLLATDWMKRKVETRFGTRARNGLYRTIYNNYTMVWLAVMFWLFSRLPDRVLYQVPRPWSILMRIGQLAGVLMILDTTFRVGAGRFTGLQQAWEYFTGRDPLPEPPAQGPSLDGDSEWSTGGSFSISRHPNNLAPTFIVWLEPRMTVTWFTFALVGSLYAIVGSIHEEFRLRSAYGDDYERYRKRVPFFVPVRIGQSDHAE
jgi:methanethiol S-methyltransferase